MTRLTNDLRDSIHRKIMTGLPVVDYKALIRTLVQDTIMEFAPQQVRELYAERANRTYLDRKHVEIRDDNDRGTGLYELFYGLQDALTVRMDPRMEPIFKDGTLAHALYTRLRDRRLFEEHKKQQVLRENVSKRLKGNLYAVSTIKRLYDVLEPELHHFIPKELEVVKAPLPSTVAPVADDLRKLGAMLPDVPKAEVK